MTRRRKPDPDRHGAPGWPILLMIAVIAIACIAALVAYGIEIAR